MNEIQTILGSKYFSTNEEGIVDEVIRVYKYDHNNTVKVYDDNDHNKKKKMTLEELNSKYTKLVAHAILSFCIVECGNKVEDVIISMNRVKDLISENPVPYCVLRQNITDLFANITDPQNTYTGCCVSMDTVPEGIDYQIMIACNDMKKMVAVSVYMDDSLEDILSLLRTKEYDLTLESLFNDHINYKCNTDATLKGAASFIKMKDSFDGYCKSLKILMEENNFMYDFYQGFRILPVNFQVTYDEQGVACEEVRQVIEYTQMVNIASTLCIPYGYDIDLSKIENSYCIIMDNTNTLYVVAYVANGRKHVELEKTESVDNIIHLANDPIAKNNKSVIEAMELIKLNKSKYNK